MKKKQAIIEILELLSKSGLTRNEAARAALDAATALMLPEAEFESHAEYLAEVIREIE